MPKRADRYLTKLFGQPAAATPTPSVSTQKTKAQKRRAVMTRLSRMLGTIKRERQRLD